MNLNTNENRLSSSSIKNWGHSQAARALNVLTLDFDDCTQHTKKRILAKMI